MHQRWPTLAEMVVTSASVAVFPPGAALARRRMMDYEFVWIMEGASVAFFDERPIAAPPGTVLLRRPGMTDRYDWAPKTRTVHAFCHFTCVLPRRGWPPTDSWPVAQLAHDADILRPLFRYLLRAHLLAEPLRSSLLRPTLELMLKAFITGCFSLATEPQVELPPPVEKAMDFIRRATFYEAPQAVCLADLASAAHVTPEHLCRLFRKSLQLGPLECVRLARLHLASTLLERSALTVKEVSDAASFATPYHFSRVFRQTYGIPPRHYRRVVADGVPVAPNPIVRLLRLTERRMAETTPQ